jgi:hypothetical protein
MDLRKPKKFSGWITGAPAKIRTRTSRMDVRNVTACATLPVESYSFLTKSSSCIWHKSAHPSFGQTYRISVCDFLCPRSHRHWMICLEQQAAWPRLWPQSGCIDLSGIVAFPVLVARILSIWSTTNFIHFPYTCISYSRIQGVSKI